MKIVLIVLAFLIALIGWFKPKTVPTLITILMVLFLVAAFIFQIVVELRERKEKAKSQYTGLLKQDRVLLSGGQEVYPRFEFGDSGAILVWTGPQGEPLFKIFDNNSLMIVIENNQLKVSTIIRDPNGHVVAELSKNEWKVNKNNSFDRNYTKNALEVKDSSGDVLLQVRLVEDRVQFQGKFYDSIGNGVALIKTVGGAIEITGPNHPTLTARIEPIFNYPSELHLGADVHPCFFITI